MTIWRKPAMILATGLAGMMSSLAEPPTKLTPRELFYGTPAPPAASVKAPPAARKSKPAKPAAASPAERAASTSSEAATGRPLGLRYSIIKYGADGSGAEVDAESDFRSGDIIRLRVRVNEPGYLYVAHKGSSGNWQVLFPSKETEGGSNEVLPGREYDVPGSTRLIFDETPGEERLFVIVARQPEAELDRIIYDLDRSQPLEDKRRKTFIAQAQIPDATLGSVRMAARDLVFEKVHGSTPPHVQAGGQRETAVYVVNATGAKDARLVADIALRHR